MTRRTALLLAALAALTAAPAAARADVEADFEVAFTTQAPGSPTGMRLALEYIPSDPNAKPPAIEGGAFRLPAGTAIDDLARPRCHASDAAVYALGRRACPPETQVGVGRLVAITGFGPPFDPFDAESHQYNAPGQVLAMIVVRGTDRAVAFDRLTIDGSSLTAHPPAVPGGPPDGRTAIKRVEMNVPAPAAGTRPYLTTPPACPPDGLWRASADFDFADGTSSSTPVTVPCEPRPLRARTPPAGVEAGLRKRAREGRRRPLNERGARSAGPTSRT